MATSAGDEFDTWLSTKLQSLNTDESVFSSYIKGILEGDETDDEKNESLEGILSEITEEDIMKHCQEIVERWRNFTKANQPKEEAVLEDVNERLVKLLENQAKPTVTARSYTDEERKLREAILAQYGQMSDHEEDEETAISGAPVPTASSGSRGGPSGVSSGGSSGGLMRNTNAEEVAKADKERREQAKLDSQRKKDKDKEDREKQKKDQQEKKEKRKTQKGERRR